VIAGTASGSRHTPALPGLQFDQRAALFDALLEVDVRAWAVRDVTVGGQSAVLLTDALAVRELLRSGARKGRPQATLVALPGYMGTEGKRRRAARGSVKAALGAAALAVSGVPEEADVSVSILAHLSGAAPGPELRVLATGSRATLRAAVDTSRSAPRGSMSPAAVSGLLHERLTGSAFVTALRERGWDDATIAGEITTLVFAGWASIAAVLRTAETFGIGGPQVGPSDIDELLRVAPPGWLITREIAESMNLSGRELPERTLVLTSPWILHRDPAQWREPERYNARRRDSRRSPAYLPFGLGEWACPAESYSRAILLELLRRRASGRAAAGIRPKLIDGRSACLEPAATGM